MQLLPVDFSASGSGAPRFHSPRFAEAQNYPNAPGALIVVLTRGSTDILAGCGQWAVRGLVAVLHRNRAGAGPHRDESV